MYTRFFLPQQPKIPMALTIVVVAVIVMFMGKLFSSSPAPSSAAKAALTRLTVANVTNNQTSIFWQSQLKSVDWLIWSDNESDLHTIELDDRDIANKKNAYLNHLVTLKKLAANKTYYFKIVSGGKLIGEFNNKPFSFKTSSDLPSTSNIKPSYGKLINKNGQSLENAAVILTFEGAIPLVSVTKSGGDWLIPLNNIQDLKSGKTKLIDKNQKIKIEIFSEEAQNSTIVSDLTSLSPVPQTVIIGRDYVFADQGSVLAAATSQVKDVETKNDILFPKEGAIIPGINPLIKGVAAPNTEVLVIVESPTTYSFRVRVDKDGVWRVNLTDHLAPGSHKITLITKNESGPQTNTERNFIIAKSGEQVLGTATISAEPTRGSVSPTVAAPIILSPTISYNVASSTPSLIKSGANPSLYVIISSSFIIAGVGMLLAF